MKKTILLFVFIFAFSSFFAIKSFGQGNGDVITCTEFHVTKPLRDLVKLNPFVESTEKKESEDRKNRIPQTFVYSDADGSIYGNDPTYMQTEMGIRKIDGKAVIKDWAGQTSGFRPYDPTGAAGPNHYIQSINATPIRIFNKSTGAVITTFNLSTLWTPATGNEGDPIILYDRYADRWFLSQFGSTSNKKIYIAISTSSDPTGTYYAYTFTSPQFPDYLKFSVWENGYYMTSNQGTDKVFCFERTAMLAGSPTARAISANFTTGATNGFFVPLPGDADGGLPPAGTPLPFFCYNDNAWGSGAIDGVKIWHMTVNWGTTPTATIALNSTLATMSFDASYDVSGWNDVVQPGTTTKLDGIGGIPTFRAQWRKWTGYNTVVLNWGVNLNASTPGKRGIMWVELRQDQSTGVWSIYQQQIYNPDIHSRWMGSIAMDDNGSIALCYAKSSSTVYPSLCYIGRLAGDPLGTMTFAETVVSVGDHVQTGMNRFGDYSQTSLDPDGITFWHTGEYIAGTANNQVKTRIYSFQLPTGAPMAGVSISITSGTNPTCAGTSVTYTASGTNGGATPSYQWKVNGTNAGTNSATFSSTTLANNDVVTCVMTSNLPGVIGNPATSNGITMTINAIPATPTISQTGMVLTSSSASGNQWYLNGSIITGATGQNYTCTSNGNYTVIVTINGCSSSPSSIVYINVGLNELNNIYGLNIFPNPNNGEFTISFNSSLKSTFKIEITDAIGKQIYNENIVDYKGTYSKRMNLSEFGKGVYTIKLTNDKNETVKKIVIN